MEECAWHILLIGIIIIKLVPVLNLSMEDVEEMEINLKPVKNVWLNVIHNFENEK